MGFAITRVTSVTLVAIYTVYYTGFNTLGAKERDIYSYVCAYVQIWLLLIWVHLEFWNCPQESLMETTQASTSRMPKTNTSKSREKASTACATWKTACSRSWRGTWWSWWRWTRPTRRCTGRASRCRSGQASHLVSSHSRWGTPTLVLLQAIASVGSVLSHFSKNFAYPSQSKFKISIARVRVIVHGSNPSPYKVSITGTKSVITGWHETYIPLRPVCPPHPQSSHNP